MGTAPLRATEERPEELVGRIQDLQEALDSAGEQVPHGLAEELVSCVVRMYGEGLERIVSALNEGGAAGERIAAGLAEDELVAMLLLIHDLHPVPLVTRVQAALDSVRPYMESHGGSVELLSVEDGVARIHLRGSCSDCSASAVTLELAIKQALEEAAPDLLGLEVEGVAPQTMGGAGLPMITNSGPGLPIVTDAEPNGMTLPMVMSEPAAAPSWFEVDSVSELRDGTMAPVTVAQRQLVIANVEGTLLAYRDACPDCASAMHDGSLEGGALACPGCGRSFFLPRAGRSLDDERIQLEPVPLLREGGHIKVALAV